MKNEMILDPLWITKGNYLDSEYFTYVLLDASMKYKKEIEKNNTLYFYEIFFHVLNLNNLAVNGSLFDGRLKEIWNDPRIKKIKSDLEVIYQHKEDTVEIFRNANYIFVQLLIEYSEKILDVLDLTKIIYVNKKIHLENEIFLVSNKSGSKFYTIWKIDIDLKNFNKNSIKKIKTIKIEELKENALKEELEKINDPKLSNLDGARNIIFAILEDPKIEKNAIYAIKDTIFLNRGISNQAEFNPYTIEEINSMLFFEKIIPFTLNDWIHVS